MPSRFLVAASLAMALSACASFRAKLNAPEELRSVNQVAVAPLRVTAPPDKKFERPDDEQAVVDSATVSGLRSAFPQVLEAGQWSAVPGDTDDQMLDKARALGMDAVLFVDASYEPARVSPTETMVNSRVEIRLVSAKDGKVLMASSHGTKWGNVYLHAPPARKTLADAAKAAVKPIVQAKKNPKEYREGFGYQPRNEW